MTSLNRRHLLAIIGTSALIPAGLRAQGSNHYQNATPDTIPTCENIQGTPQVVPYDSDIPFDQAYIDTMIPHHESVIDLATDAKDVLEDDRLVTIAQAILDTQPGEIAQLMAFREEWYGRAEPDEMTEEMMMVTTGDLSACENSHDMTMDANMDMMNMMDSEWILSEFDAASNKDLAFIDLVIPHHQMAVYQSMVGLELAEHEALRTLCEEVIAAQNAEIEELEAIREDIV